MIWRCFGGGVGGCVGGKIDEWVGVGVSRRLHGKADV